MRINEREREMRGKVKGVMMLAAGNRWPKGAKHLEG